MTVKVLMPALSPTMTEGKLAKWLVKEGDEVASGDVIAEIETDKATMEVEAVEEGVVGKIVVAEGTEGVPVNDVIAILLEEGEDKSALDGAGSGESPAPSKPEPSETTPSKSDTAPAAQATQPQSAPKSGAGEERVLASPLAKRMAEQAGLTLSTISGSGPNGRIVKADVEAAVKGGTTAASQPGATPATAATTAVTAPASAPTASGPGAKQLADMLGMEYRQEPLTSMRKVIAKRLTESKQTVPHFYLTVDCQVDELLKVRKDLNSRSDAYKLSVNDFVIRAAALALKKVPAANASYDESGILYYKHADISVAVATPAGLITPIIKAAEGKGLAEISNAMKDLAIRARDGKLTPEEYQGGTFSISNLGMFGVKHFEAVINPPQGCILAVGAGEQRAVVKDGALAIGTVMSCTLSVDHRVVDGAVGAEYLAAFKVLIEDPLSMLL
ncbi:pyruvate dehydrogenase complex dihydrolipoamide acetyltransferase [Limibacillus halophilus]|uniref:Acetyltransferase component of pyruvate dehydrogenase complex n=1 Tax=Limibacillus halophilus TaxID=1579333 RepID=A0A839STU5_9PROT|nr:pyruvate dehydrogenase complex dihydrolipoamide acetyltransferase [Limibacillus halophilus]MBB3065912.1 pyruvate dehydrogenase E2 component (dihydrolipoamide acetyltransferase) [Limibacillus halophilus]